MLGLRLRGLGGNALEVEDALRRPPRDFRQQADRAANPPRQPVLEEASGQEHIRLRRRPQAPEDLRRRIGDPRPVHRLSSAARRAGKSEIDEHSAPLALRRQDQVPGMDVQMKDPVGMQVRESLEEVENGLEVSSRQVVRRGAGRKGHSGDVFPGVKGDSSLLRVAKVIGFGDPGMAERGDGPELELHAADRGLGQAVHAQHLQGNQPFLLAVEGKVHRPEAARAELSLHDVSPRRRGEERR